MSCVHTRLTIVVNIYFSLLLLYHHDKCDTAHKKGKSKREKEVEVPQTIHVSSEKNVMFHFPKGNVELSAKWLKYISRVG